MFRLRVVVLGVLFLLPNFARAGLYYSGEEMAPLPSQWRGYLLDQRLLRTIAIKPTSTTPQSPLRSRYEQAVQKLEKASKERKLTAEEQADLGALHLRLGEVARGLAVLRAAHKDFPDNFHVTANLGTAWQMSGDLTQAAACLQQAVKLAPADWKPYEEAHLKLVRLRTRSPDGQELDDLFGVRYVNAKGDYEPGQLATEQRDKLGTAVSTTQQLALWLPTDGRLLWQLAELAAAYGDFRTAAAMMDGCVTEFAMRSRDLAKHRQAMRAAADEYEKKMVDKTMHEGHVGTLKTRSSRPLVHRSVEVALPAIKPDGLNNLPWEVVTRTTVDRRYKPTFPKYLQDLDGKKVQITGFMQPLSENLESGIFVLIEYPVGCWYCEIPELIAMVYVEMPQGKAQTFSRDLLQITGKLKLNSKDPEDFLYTISEAAVETMK